MGLEPRAVIVHRRTEYDELIAHHGTAGQAEFFLRQRGLDLAAAAARHAAYGAVLARVSAQVPTSWRRAMVERADLGRFLFAPEDVVVVVGQDGLVANVARCLDGQPVVGVNPDPSTNPGVLVRHEPGAAGSLMRAAAADRIDAEERTMVEAALDDGSVLTALNEVFVGHASHQSARYAVQVTEGVERQSSSGLLVGTGTGATGWLRSVVQERLAPVPLPAPEDAALAWFVREAWPSPATGTSLTQGLIARDESITLTSFSEDLVVFGDGMESDALHLAWGQRMTARVSPSRLLLVR